MRHGIAATALVALALAATASGCTQGQRQDLVGDVAAEGLRIAAENAFEGAGFPIEGQLDCKVEDVGSAETTANCGGSTQEGADVAFKGSYNSEDADFTNGVEGSFSGKVNGDTVFSTDCLACGGQ